MLARIRKSMDDKDQGFTLIELLVVMIIIGILAAIAIPVFLNQRKKAVDTSMKSDLRQVSGEMEAFYTDNQTYPATASTPAAPVVISASTSVTLSPGNLMTITNPARNGATGTYCLIVSRAASASASTQSWVYISDKGGLQAAGITVCS